MSRYAVGGVMLLALVLALTFAGCDELAGPSPTPTETATPVPTVAPTPTAQPTATPTQAPVTQTPTPSPTPEPTPQVTTPPSITALPCRYRGSVELSGTPVADGTQITVTIAGDTYSTITPSIYGDSTYVIMIEPSGVTYSPGTVVTFAIAGQPAAQTSVWEQGGNLEVDISAP